MKLKQRLTEINKLEAIETPWEVLSIFGKLELYGSQIRIISDDQRDSVDLEDFRQALNWLTDQAGGYIIWDESVKKGKKK